MNTKMRLKRSNSNRRVSRRDSGVRRGVCALRCIDEQYKENSMIFHKIYSIYIYTCERLIRQLLQEPGPMDEAIENLELPEFLKTPFRELMESKEVTELFGELHLMQEDGANNHRTMPEYGLTKLEKQWIKAILNDPRVKLFDVSFTGLDDVEPLYHLEDYVYFDRPAVSDPWMDCDYIEHFRMVYRAYKENQRLALVWREHENSGWLKYTNTPAWAICRPVHLEYDSRLDAMFIHAECDYHGKKGVSSKCIRIPMHSIVSCKLADALACAEIWKPRCSLLLCDAKRMTEVEHERAELRKSEKSAKPKKNRVACLSITDKHDALSRSLNCFASYQKRDVVCVSEEEKLYRLEFYYDWRVDSESIVNDILSLGKNVCVESPNELAWKVQLRFKKQKELQNRFEAASVHTIVNQDDCADRANVNLQEIVSFEKMRPFVMKVVVTRPNTEVRICCLRQAICREPESDDFSYREDYHLLYEADCDGDGIYEKICQTGDLIHVYEKPGIYTIAMRGNVGHILLRDAKHGNLELSEISNYAPDADDYYWFEVCQWGDIAWRSMAYMFSGACMIRIPAMDAPDLSRVETMECMFYNCIKLNDPVEHWIVSNVKNMAMMFERATEFDQPLDAWDVSNVQNMAGMFAFASSFNHSLGSWNVSNVWDMTDMFKMAESFNQPLDAWDVSHVKSMAGMLCGAISYRQILDNWNVSALELSDNMFAGAVSMTSLPKWRNHHGV